jgi:hypothetical protein
MEARFSRSMNQLSLIAAATTGTTGPASNLGFRAIQNIAIIHASSEGVWHIQVWRWLVRLRAAIIG